MTDAATPITIPDVAGLDTLAAAFAYGAAGLYLVPVRPRTKAPGGYLGKGWPSKSVRTGPDIHAMWEDKPEAGIGIHAGRSGLVVVDIDKPDRLDERVKAAIIDLSPPFQVTRRLPGAGNPATWPDVLSVAVARLARVELRGHAVFRLPPGRMLGNGLGKLTKGWGDIRGRNGFIVTAPSPHEEPDGEYRWLRTGVVPYLPDGVADQLADASGTDDEATATDEQVAAFKEACREGNGNANWVNLVNAVLKRFQDDVAAGEGRHTAALRAATWMAREAAAGQYSAGVAFADLRREFKLAVSGDAAPRASRTAPGALDREFGAIEAWAVGQALTTSPERLAQVRQRLTSDHGGASRPGAHEPAHASAHEAHTRHTRDPEPPPTGDDAAHGPVDEEAAELARLTKEREDRDVAHARHQERVRRRVKRELDAEEMRGAVAARRLRLLDGWTFLAEDDEADEMIWGQVQNPGGGLPGVMWAPGEPMMLFGGNGVFKSTLSHLLVFARLGLLGPDGRPRADHRRIAPDDHPDDWGAVLGMPVRPMDPACTVVYLAGDRPRQIRRAMRRHRRDWMADTLRDHLIVHDGPLPFELTAGKDALADMAQERKGSDIFVDSLKDYCPKPSDDESANGYNRSRQECIARGMQWVEDHHNRKMQQGQKPTNAIDDVYGSRWLTAGAGSVVSMWVDEEGSTAVHVKQVKSPGEFVPELEVRVHKADGTMGASVHLDPVAQIRAAGTAGITVADYARMTGLTPNAARNQLNTRCKQGVLEKLDPVPGADGPESMVRFRTILGVRSQTVGNANQMDGLGGGLF